MSDYSSSDEDVPKSTLLKKVTQKQKEKKKRKPMSEAALRKLADAREKALIVRRRKALERKTEREANKTKVRHNKEKKLVEKQLKKTKQKAPHEDSDNLNGFEQGETEEPLEKVVEFKEKPNSMSNKYETSESAISRADIKVKEEVCEDTLGDLLKQLLLGSLRKNEDKKRRKNKKKYESDSDSLYDSEEENKPTTYTKTRTTTKEEIKYPTSNSYLNELYDKLRG